MKNKFRGPPYPPKKADFGRTKAKMGCFSKKGLCYSFGILQGLLSKKNIRNPMTKSIWGLPINPYFYQKMGKIGEIDSADTCAGKFPLVPMGG